MVRPLGSGAFVRWTSRADGDLRPPPGTGRHGALEVVADRPVAWAAQVHGAAVVVAGGPGPWGTGDALVTTRPGLGVAVFTADCAPVALSGGHGPGPDHVVAAVHAGWRGLGAGVVGAAVAELRAHGATRFTAAVGPCIHAECYPVGTDVLAPLAERFGPEVASVTDDGRPALDLPAAVRAALARAGVDAIHDNQPCTACTPASCFSHRARGDAGRQAMVVWGDGA